MKVHLKAAALAALSGLWLAGSPAGATAGPDEKQITITNLSGAYLAARTAEIDNDLENAIRYYETAVAMDKDNMRLVQSLLTSLVLAGELDRAIPYAEQLKTEPEAERFSRLLLAVNAISAKQFSAAEILLKLALQTDLDRLIAQIMTAWAKLGAGDAGDAIAHLDNLEGPGWYGLFTKYHKAMIAEAAGMDVEAASFYTVTADLAGEGRSAPATYLRFIEAHARFKARKGDTESALEVLEQARNVTSNEPRIDGLRERIAAGKKPAPMAVSARDGAAEILLNMATAINRPGSGPFAQFYLQLANALRKDDSSTLIQMAGYAEGIGKPELAISYYKRVADGSLLKRVAELQLGLNLADIKKYDEAETHLRALIDQRPDDVRAYLALGSVYGATEEFAKSAALYDRAASVLGEPQREHWNIYYQRGIAHERNKDWAKAEPNFLTALELYPDQPQVLNYLGYSWVDMNIRLEEGLDLIRKAVDLRPRDGYIVDSLGWAYYRLGRFEEAVTELERAVSLKPDDPIVNDHLGDAYWRAGRKLEATFQWRHARDMKPEPEELVKIEKKLKEGMAPLGENDAVATPENGSGNDTRG